MTRNATRTLNLDFTYLEFYQNYVISTVKEGTILEEEQVDELIDTCKEHYGDEAFVYISNRKFSYNVNPLIYLNLFKIENLEGIAVTSSNPDALKTANFERHFSQVPVELFQGMDEAKAWANSLTKK
ncbi:hypothetical protein NE848_10990 [Gramella jeungdoensis]|uniref:STAS/SEC14 domain-containing protein n=1 Tax=Gramella jeungdoensis TaxID=708091 RepID=A0ABT0Z2D6_9FLAO|nr:hypothetical protein [Gramella jeungdoensis]MCM8569906.1 hypothetical protein [Gramella jeungdoensis]